MFDLKRKALLFAEHVAHGRGSGENHATAFSNRDGSHQSSLGLFLTMALMGLQLWVLEPVMVFMTTVMALQIVLAVGFTALVVFRCMGRDYEATVICSGFGGIALGSTATAIANMSAIVRVYGAAPRAFLVVPLVCGFFIDLVNALVIGVLAR